MKQNSVLPLRNVLIWSCLSLELGFSISVLIVNVYFQAKIAFLQGERKGQENLKNDLVRRIKMLEYALKQERWVLSSNICGSIQDNDTLDTFIYSKYLNVIFRLSTFV